MLVLLMGVFSISLFAEIYKFQAQQFAYKYQYNDGSWADWSDWEKSSLLIVMNTDNDRIRIYSDSPQEYDVYNYQESYVDSDGWTTSTLNCVDADGTQCELRLRVSDDGDAQLYVDYTDVMWVYNIVKK